MNLNPEQIEGALVRLAALMDDRGVTPLNLLVCGGSALNAFGIRPRTTRDVDVIGLVQEDGTGHLEFVLVEEWPEPMPELIDQVARDLGFPLTDEKGHPLPADRKWLNLGPRLLLRNGLPDALEARVEKHTYGNRLSVYYTGRQDLIAFKIYAALTSDRRSVHLLDLMHLNPDEEEMRTALRWVIGRPMAPGVREKVLPDVLRTLDYGHLV